MCEECENYNEFPAITIGGPAGDYSLDVPVQSCRWAEYQVASIASQVAAQVVVSGESAPKALTYDGSKTLSNDTFIVGSAYTLSANQPSVTPNDGWTRITHSQKRVFVRIDCAGGNSAYVTIRFRARLHKVIPGPTEAVHPDLGHQLNVQRAERIKERVEARNKVGIPEREWNRA